MRTNNYQVREAARIGNDRVITASEAGTLEASEKRAREIRRENIRRSEAAQS